MVRALASQPVATAIVDGEVVAATPAGVPSFERL
jgi:ATP-dependent DNA ligase